MVFCNARSDKYCQLPFNRAPREEREHMSMDFPAADIGASTTLPGAAMTKRTVTRGHRRTICSVLATGLLALGTICGGASAAEPITQVNISHVSAQFATGVPQVAVSRTDPNLIAV